VVTITVEEDRDRASLTYHGRTQEALVGEGFIAEDGEVVEWFERAEDVTEFVRIPRATPIEIVTPGGSVRSFGIGRPASGDGYWIMINDSPPPRDILASEELGPVRYVIEVLVERADGTWSDVYFGIELFAPEGKEAVVVPNIVGLQQGEATQLLHDVGLAVEVEKISSARPEGEVWRSQPPPGSVVFPDIVVTLQVSTGPEG
jgi:hypothetical protein